MNKDEHLEKIVRLLISNLEKILSCSVGSFISPEELALEFDDWYSALIPKFERDLTARQSASLSALDSYLSKISGEENEVLWTHEAFVDSTEWRDVRLIANMIIESFSS